MSTAPFILHHGSPQVKPDTEFIKSLRFRFSFVRDPYTRFASAVLNLMDVKPEGFEKFVTVGFIKDKEKYLDDWNWKKQELIPQHKYLFFDGKLEVDILGRFENIEEDWQRVCDKMGVQHKLPHLNKGKHRDYDTYYTKKTRDIVYEAYKTDFVLLGYPR